MEHTLFVAALCGPTLFLLIALILGAITPHYRPLHNTISELALGRYKWAHAVNYVLCGSLIALLGCLLLSKHLYSYSAVAVVIFGLVIVLSAIFPTDPVPTPKATTTGKIHNALFFVGMLAIISGQFVAGFSGGGSALGVFSLVCGIVCFFLLPITVTRKNYMGLFQRVLVLVVMAWVSGFALLVW